MKTEEKQLVCEHLDRFRDQYNNKTWHNTMSIEIEQFKKDNNLLTNVSGWYLSNCKQDEKWVGFYDFEKKIAYGISPKGHWFYHDKELDLIIEKDEYPATQQQVEERLFPFFEKMYPKGTEIKAINGSYKLANVNGTFFINKPNEVCSHEMDDKFFGHAIMQDGILAEIISENQNDKAIKALDKAIELLMDKKKNLKMETINNISKLKEFIRVMAENNLSTENIVIQSNNLCELIKKELESIHDVEFGNVELTSFKYKNINVTNEKQLQK